MDFTPIEDYGIIGNLETCALVSREGAIDWCCLPFIDSPSLFSALLDREGGQFIIQPETSFESEQHYIDRTNVLQTEFRTDSGEATVTDFMPVTGERKTEQPGIRALYRKVTCTEGSVDLGIEFRPQFDYARAQTTVEPVTGGVFATGANWHAFLSSPISLQTETGSNTALTSTSLEEDDTLWFVLQYSMVAPREPEECEQLLNDTIEFWRDWAHSCDRSECLFAGTGHDQIVRSELLLKLLTYRETGAISAAPTTSLPEDIGGVRNWDYRFSWIRDGAMTIRALTNLGHIHESKEYLNRFLRLSREADPADIQPLYGVEGETDLTEEELEHLSGYQDSRPVRIGNEAAEQQQFDVYGEIVLTIYQLLWSDRTIAEEDWHAVREISEYVCDNWQGKDAGIWEVRGGPKHLVYSKVMCWVAIDRSIALAEQENFEAPLERWRDTRETIKETVLENGYDDELGSFTQAFGTQALDATGLLIPLTGFLPFDDPRVEGTIETIRDRLGAGDGLLYRYEEDDLPGEEGAFVLCSFWLVDVLALSGRTDEAWEVFENVLSHTNSLGLLSEEIDPETGAFLGNYPQAFSHIGLINSALYLREAEYDWATVEPFGEPTLEQEHAELERKRR
jgi:GH15 family glucan-1,4-alpha-glucosidase